MSSVQETSAALAAVGETFTQRARFSDAEIRAFAVAGGARRGYRGLIAS